MINTSNAWTTEANLYLELNAPGRTYWPFFTRTKTINARW